MNIAVFSSALGEEAFSICISHSCVVAYSITSQLLNSEKELKFLG